jgi:hypothetical protein
MSHGPIERIATVVGRSPRLVKSVAMSAAFVVIAATGAFAYIQATGEGGGDAEADSLAGVDLYGETAAELVPGGTATVLVTYTNPNGFSVRAVHGIHLAVEPADLPATCDPAQFVFADTGAIDLAAGQDDAPLPTHLGGTITWEELPDGDQAACMADLADLGGVPLKLTM